MRKIRATQIALFFVLLACAVALALATDFLVLGSLPLGDFRGVAMSLFGVALFYAYAMLIYRMFMAWFPLTPGYVPLSSALEFRYHIHLLFFLFVFYPIMRSGFVPVPLMRLFYQALGARFGPNSYSAGIVYDPCFVQMGSNTLVGQGALLIPHAIEGEHLSHTPVVLGNNVTIGAYAIVFGGCNIGDGAIVAAASVVSKGSQIGANEVWAGVPARMIKKTAHNDKGA